MEGARLRTVRVPNSVAGTQNVNRLAREARHVPTLRSMDTTRVNAEIDLPRRLDDKARREAIKVGLTALRARGRRAKPAILGGFRLLDREGNCVAGDNYDLSAEDVIKFCNRIP